MTDYPIVLDLWEGNERFDAKQALDAGIVGAYIRLNDMNGGHHRDQNFAKLWDMFELKIPYFVYNPWKKGNVNFDKFMEFVPTDSTKVVALDLEVKYKDYSPREYANQVFDMIVRLEAEHWKVIAYTGYGYLSIMNRWPDIDYIWARYLNAAKPKLNTWDELVKTARSMIWEPDRMGDKNVCPGTVRMWQIADSWSPPGCYNHSVDVNIFDGTLNELKKWWGYGVMEIPAPVETPWADMDWKQRTDWLKTKVEGL
jgi:GH25 family lysozyme M1 (1,4-beta-N-acetylmuramidase)